MEYPPGSWERLERQFRDVLVKQSEDHLDRSADAVQMVGFVFARPESTITKTEIIPSLSYFHSRSKNFITFLFAGYHDATGKDVVVAEVASRAWTFSVDRFNYYRETLEAKTKWRYSGSADLILTNVRLQKWQDEYHPESVAYDAYFDFASAICIDLAELRASGAILGVERFFEEIFRYAENQDGFDPTWGFSDKMGSKVARFSIL